METLIGLALILGLWEFREYRNERKRKLERIEFKSMKRHLLRELDELMKVVRQQQFITEDQMKEIAGLKIIAVKTMDDLLESRRFIETADASLQTIIKEYELNGVPLGYERRKQREPDFIEGI